MKMLLQCLANNDETWNHDKSGDVICPESSLGFEDSVMGSNVSVCQEVVEEMTEEFSQGNSYDWCEIEKPESFGVETVSACYLRCCKEN